VDFSLKEQGIDYQFTPDELVPPGWTTLLLERAASNVNASTHTVHIVARSQTSNVSKELALTYYVVPSGRQWLTLWTWYGRVRLGRVTALRGKLLPAQSGQNVVLEIQKVSEDGTKTPYDSISLTTKINGGFSYDFPAQELGTYEFTAVHTPPGSPSVRSAIVQLDVVSRESRVSLRVKVNQLPRVGVTYDFGGQVAPVAGGEYATVELKIWYNLSSGVASSTDSVQVVAKDGIYSGSFTLKEAGTARLQAVWLGDPPQTDGAESPYMVFPVLEASGGNQPQEIEPYDPGACVLIASATSSNLVSPVRDYLTNLSYFVLRSRRFHDARLAYVNDESTQDVNWDGIPDNVVDITASSAQAVQQGIELAAKYAGTSSPVSLFIIGDNVQGESLVLGDDSQLSASALDSLLLSTLGVSRDVRILVDASKCGEFCSALACPNRTVIGSASEESASFAAGGLLSFSQLYLTQVQAGWNVEDSFEYAKDYLRAAFGYYGAQTPLLITSEEQDPEFLYYGVSSDATDMLAPDIEGVFEPTVLDGTTSMEIYARASDDTGIYAVEATVRKPDGVTISVPLTEDALETNKYVATLNAVDLDQLGTYEVAFIAIDAYRNCSEPQSSQISLISTADLNGDSVIDARDVCLLVEEMSDPDSLFDIIDDGQLDYLDILALAMYWHR